MTQAFIIVLRIDENKLDPKRGQHIEATIKELHRSASKADSSCNIYQVKDPVKLVEWENNLKVANGL